MVLHDSQERLDMLSSLESYVKEEINVKEVSRVLDGSLLK